MNTSIFLNPRVTFYGLLSWVVPFIASIAFFDQTGELQIPEQLFKSIMIVVGSVQSFSQICLNWRASFVYLKRFWVFVCLL